MSQEFSIDLTSRLTTEEIVVLRNKFDLRPNEVEQIQVLIENVDKILNIQDHDSAKPINIDTSNKEWVKMSSLDIFKFTGKLILTKSSARFLRAVNNKNGS